MQYKDKINIPSPEDVLDACDFIEKFQEELEGFDARLTGSSSETATARHIRDRLHEETGACVRLEAYKAHPLEGRGCMILLGIWYFICAVLYFISFAGNSLAGILMTLFTLCLFLGGGYVFVKLFLGQGGKLKKLLPSRVSYNVISERAPSLCERDKERTVLICANHDDLYGSYAQNFSKIRKLVFVVAPISAFIFVLFCVLKMALGADSVSKITAFTIIPFFSSLAGVLVLLAHFSPFRKHSRQNSGLSTAVALASYAYFVENPDLLPDNIRIVFASFGGESSAHGGSRAFVNTHSEYNDMSVIALGDITSGEFKVASGDAIRKIANSSKVICALNHSAAEQNIPLKTLENSSFKEKLNCLHGFVSNAFAKSNIPSTTVLAKDYGVGEGVVRREDVERLFALVVAAAAELMEDDG